MNNTTVTTTNTVTTTDTAARKGLVKLPKTEVQLVLEKQLSFVEKTINLAKMIRAMQHLAVNHNRADIIAQPQLAPVWYRIGEFADKIVGASQERLLKMAAVADQAGVLNAFREAYKTLRDVRGFMAQYNISVRGPKGIFVSIGSNGVTINWDPTYGSDLVKYLCSSRTMAQQVVSLNSDSFSPKSLQSISQVLVFGKNGDMYRHNILAYGSYGHNLQNYCVEHLGLVDVIGLMSLYKVDQNSLFSDDRNFIIIEHLEYEKDEETKEMFIVSPNAYANKHVLRLNDLGKFWGISNPDVMHKGILRAIDGSPGFGELTDEGTYRTIAGHAAKLVARSIKLVKFGESLMIPKLLVVVDANGNERAIDALSTGTVHVPRAVWNKYGQCRAVSSAEKGGVKCTFAPGELIDPLMAANDIAIASFGSLKSNLYGVRELLGIEAESIEDLEVKSMVFKNWGPKPVKVVVVRDVELVTTNHYTIQSYTPVNRDKIAADWDEANTLLAQRIAQKANTVQEDALFTSFVQDERDNRFDGDLVATLEGLEAEGVIRKKSNKVGITSSEYDMMAMCMGLGKAVEWQNNMLTSSLNLNNDKKDADFKRLLEIKTGDFSKSSTKYITANEFYTAVSEAFKANNISFKSPVGNFTSRDLLVDLFTGIFAEDGCEWLVVTGPKGDELRLPLGDFMMGSFADTSYDTDSKVQVTGFVSKLLKHLFYSLSSFSNNKFSNKQFVTLISNMRNELLAEATGKSVGKLDAYGLYGVLSPAWWVRGKDADVVCPAARRFSKQLQALICKHPLLFDMSLAGVNVYNQFPKWLTKDLSKEMIRRIGVIFGTTIFASALMLLSLQNDCDGDLIRLTWHEGIEFENFTAKTIAPDAVGSKWFNDYIKAEEGFDVVKEVSWSEHTVRDVAEGICGAKYAKDCVAKFTNNAQHFAARCTVDLGLDKNDLRYHTIHRILNIWVQEFSMNAIKHKQQDGGDDLLPEYYMISSLKAAECSGKEINEGQHLLLEWLAEKEIDMAKHGFTNNLDFAQQLHYMLCNIQDRSVGTTLVGKDVRLVSIKDEHHDLLEGGVEANLDSRIMQDRLLLAYARKLGFK